MTVKPWRTLVLDGPSERLIHDLGYTDALEDVSTRILTTGEPAVFNDRGVQGRLDDLRNRRLLHAAEQVDSTSRMAAAYSSIHAGAAAVVLRPTEVIRLRREFDLLTSRPEWQWAQIAHVLDAIHEIGPPELMTGRPPKHRLKGQLAVLKEHELEQRDVDAFRRSFTLYALTRGQRPPAPASEEHREPEL
jgi:hypothetical protein